MKKNTITLFMMIAFSTLLNAQNSYTNLWEKVQKFEVDNLPKSALKVVDDIYTQAQKEKNSPQIIKTLFYKSKFSLILEEDAQLKVINQFKKHIAESNFPTKNVLENILANLYWQYFNQHRYQFYNRTKIDAASGKGSSTSSDSSSGSELDFRTWDLNTLFKEIHIHYQNSLTNGLLLQQTNISDFAPILHLQKDSKIYRPTLFDFLSHNALEFYKTSETNITKPSYQFKIDNPNLLKDARTFSRINIETKDHLSLQLNAIKIYQNLIAAHINDKDARALVTVDLERLQFVKQHATFNHKEELYLQILKTSQEKYKTNEVSGLYGFEVAQIYHQKANSYTSNKEVENRFKNKEAIAICHQIIKDFPESVGAKKCKLLLSKIEQKALHITAEEHISIGSNSRLLVDYKNIDKLYFTGYEITKNQQEKLNKLYKDDEKVTFIKKLKRVQNWSSTLRNEHDYLQHTTEVIVPKLASGIFLIVASESEELNSKNIYGTTSIQSTNLALVENNFDGKYTYQVVNRNTGKPIKEAKIHLYNHNTNRRSYTRIDKTFITDKNGFAFFRSKNYYNNVQITVSHKNDCAIFGDLYLYNQSRNNVNRTPKAVTKTFLFTDR